VWLRKKGARKSFSAGTVLRGNREPFLFFDLGKSRKKHYNAPSPRHGGQASPLPRGERRIFMNIQTDIIQNTADLIRRECETDSNERKGPA